MVGAMADGGWGPGREWALLEGRAECWFAGPSHAAGARLISELARLDLPGPVPEFDLRRTGVNVRIQQQVPGLDPGLAGTNSDLAGSAGLRSEPGSVQRF